MQLAKLSAYYFDDILVPSIQLRGILGCHSVRSFRVLKFDKETETSIQALDNLAREQLHKESKRNLGTEDESQNDRDDGGNDSMFEKGKKW